MPSTSRLLAKFWLAVTLTLALATSTLAADGENESLNAYISAMHTRLFEQFSTVVLGDVSIAKAAFRGPLGIQGKADISDFDIGSNLECKPDVRALTVANVLTARMGTINHGYTVVGRRTSIHHSVRLACTNRIERHDVRRNQDPDFDQMRVSLIREVGDMCIEQPTGTTENRNGTLHFDPGEKGFSCYTYFKVQVDDLRLVSTWKYDGDDFYRNIVIVVSGLRSDMRNFRMEGFNPRRTLITYCAVYGLFDLHNAKIQASILAPTSSFTTTETIINGSAIFGGLRGSLAVLHNPYAIC